KSVNFI
ncbi:unnamed protein product, partial [Allacma fusca]